jgi:hypothetical protein
MGYYFIPEKKHNSQTKHLHMMFKSSIDDAADTNGFHDM